MKFPRTLPLLCLLFLLAHNTAVSAAEQKKQAMSLMKSKAEREQEKQEQLKTELSETEKPWKKQRLEGKLATVEEQITRSEWLLREIGSVKTP